ncbi:MAG: hypothetical protein ACTSRG_25340 [Candidatus Helarchaeota archaeon]
MSTVISIPSKRKFVENLPMELSDDGDLFSWYQRTVDKVQNATERK